MQLLGRESAGDVPADDLAVGNICHERPICEIGPGRHERDAREPSPI